MEGKLQSLHREFQIAKDETKEDFKRIRDMMASGPRTTDQGQNSNLVLKREIT